MADPEHPASGADPTTTLIADERIWAAARERATHTILELAERARRMNGADASLARAIESMLRDLDEGHPP